MAGEGGDPKCGRGRDARDYLWPAATSVGSVSTTWRMGMESTSGRRGVNECGVSSQRAAAVGSGEGGDPINIPTTLCLI